MAVLVERIQATLTDPYNYDVIIILHHILIFFISK